MREISKIVQIGRRQFLLSASAAAGLLPLIAKNAHADGPSLERSKQFEETFAKLTSGATPVADKIAVDLPELADNGNFVPITMTVDSPMTDSDHVKAIHIVSTANPVALVATFHLSPINAVARVQSRMRLAKTQDVIVLAELSSGQLLISTTAVKVTIGGCGD
jgi:sulfur-oxidizing protein SoxY